MAYVSGGGKFSGLNRFQTRMQNNIKRLDFEVVNGFTSLYSEYKEYFSGPLPRKHFKIRHWVNVSFARAPEGSPSRVNANFGGRSKKKTTRSYETYVRTRQPTTRSRRTEIRHPPDAGARACVLIITHESATTRLFVRYTRRVNTSGHITRRVYSYTYIRRYVLTS